MRKTQAFAIVRYDDYLAHHEVDIDMLIKVVKVYLDEQEACDEADRLNGLQSEHPSRYWVVGTKFIEERGGDTDQSSEPVSQNRPFPDVSLTGS